MLQFVEPRVRRAVVEHLGVGIEDLALEVSLTDDLAWVRVLSPRGDFAWLGEYGVHVEIARRQEADPLGVPTRPSVAA